MNKVPESSLQRAMARYPWALNLWAVTAAFGTYFCMYGFRRPYAAGSFEDLEFLGLDFKTLLILAQVAGYTLSKFAGIRVVSSMSHGKRIGAILLFIGVAHLALLLFGILPYPWNFICLFLNGLPLGMIWGLVFSFLEGRRHTELLGAGLSASFIVSSGFVKSVGLWFLQEEVCGEFWMPFVSGAVFVLPLIGFVWMLGKIPEPSDEDVAMRTERVPMTATDRRYYLRNLGLGLVFILIFHMGLTAFRDIRDNFAVEILKSVGHADSAANLSRSEVVIAFVVLVILGLLYRIRSNRRALQFSHGIMLAGCLIPGTATWLHSMGWLHSYLWFLLMGLGVYLAYVPIQSMYFDRVIAVFRHKSNAGYLIYLADFSGYLAAVAVMLYRSFGNRELSWLSFFSGISYALSAMGALLLVGAMVFFHRRVRSLEGY